MALIGYARVSTHDQNLDLQLDALRAAGVDENLIYTDEGVSGAKASRPGLDAALKAARPGDVLTVWRLDRLGRSIKNLIMLVEDLRVRDVQFKSLTEAFDTTTPGGKLVFHIFAGLAEMERDLTRERVHAGLAAAKARGRTGGRPTKLTTAEIEQITWLYAQSTNPNAPEGTRMTVKDIATRFGVSRATIYRVMGERSQQA